MGHQPGTGYTADDTPAETYDPDLTPPATVEVIATSDGFLIQTVGCQYIAVSDAEDVYTPDVTPPFT